MLCTPAIGAGAVAAPAADLPLAAARHISFDTDQGTWLSVTLSPDGETIVFDMLGDLYRLGVRGGVAQRITEGMAFDSQPAWSADGASLAFVSDRDGAENVWVMRADGSQLRRVTSNEGPESFVSPAWSADGHAVFVSLFRADRNAIELWRYEVADGSREELTTPGVNALGAAAARDGRHLYYAKRAGQVVQDDVKLPLWSIERRELATGRTETLVAHQGSAMRPLLSPDGTRLAYAARENGQTALRLRELATGDDRIVLSAMTHDAQEAVPTRDLVPGYAFTPDGKALVTTREGRLVRVDIDSGRIDVIPFEAHVELGLGPLLRQSLAQETGAVRARLIQEPRESADGRHLAFSALGRVYRLDLRSGARPQRLTSDGPPEFHPTWSPDGRTLAYVTWTGSEGGAVWLADLRSGRVRRLTGSGAFYTDVVFTPDGGALLALRSSTYDRRHTLQEPLWTGRSDGFLRQAELVEIALSDGGERVIASGPMAGAAQFGRDADAVFVNTDAGLEQIRRDGSARSVVLKVTGPAYYFLDGPAPAGDIKLSPDGRHALVLLNQQLYLVTLAGLPAAAPIDVAAGDASVRRLTAEGADFSGWADGGRTIVWALGATYFRSALSAVQREADRLPLRRGTPGVSDFEATVELPRDVPRGRWLLRGATIVTMRGDEVIADADLLVDGNRIAAVGRRGTLDVPHGTSVVDATGQFVVPGFIDAHMHFGGIRRNVLELDDWGLRASLAYGMTAALDPSSLSIDMFAYQDLVDAGSVLGPRLYTTGTAMFSFNRLRSLGEARDLLLRYRDFYRTRNVKQYRIGPRRARQWVAMAAHELGMMPTTEGALDMKLGLTHVLDGFAGNEHSLGIYPLYRDVVELLARSQTSSVLTLQISHGGPPAGDDFIVREAALTDSRLARWFPPQALERAFARVPWVTPRDYIYGHMAADAAAVQRAGGVVGLGAHGDYPGIGLHWEMQAHAAGGMTPHEILRAATLGSATAIGRAAELGSLEPGKLADFVILSRDPREDIRNTLSIGRVVKDGRIYDAATLDEVWPRQRAAPRLWFEKDRRGD